MYTHKTGQKITDGFLMGPLANDWAKSHFILAILASLMMPKITIFGLLQN